MSHPCSINRQACNIDKDGSCQLHTILFIGRGFNTARGTLLLDIYTFEFFSSFRTVAEELFQTSKGNLFSSKIAMLVTAVLNTL